MPFDIIERRAEPRTQAFVPVTLTCHDAGEEMPAHLLDLSCGGAGILLTAYNAPAIGQYLDVRFDQQEPGALQNTDGGTESSIRQETGIRRDDPSRPIRLDLGSNVYVSPKNPRAARPSHTRPIGNHGARCVKQRPRSQVFARIRALPQYR